MTMKMEEEGGGGGGKRKNKFDPSGSCL